MKLRAKERHSSDNELENYFRRIYIFERRHYDFRYRRHKGLGDYLPGSHWDGGKGRKPIWPRGAAFFRKHDFPPHDFIRHQFETIDAIFGDPPYPNQVIGAGAIKIHKAAADNEQDVVTDHLEYLERSFQSAKSRIKYCAEYDEGDMTEEEAALSSPLEPELSPVFCFCRADSLGLHRVTKHLLDAAAMYYMRAQAAHDAAWGDFISKDVKIELEDRYFEILEEIPGY